MKKIVFTYHRVGSMHSDYNNTCVSKANFVQQIIYIKTHFKILSMEDFLDYSGNETVATITFDDGYKDTVNTVLPIIEKYNIPITIFVTCTEQDGKEFWMSDIMRMIFEGEFENSKLSFEIDGHRICLAVKDINDKCNAYLFFRRLFRECNREFRKSILEELHVQSNVEWKSRIEFCPLDEEDLTIIAKNKLITLGAHTIEHVSLAKFTEDIQRLEITNCIERIQSYTGKRVKYFAYPFGYKDDYNDITIKVLKENDIKAAFTTEPKIIDSDDELILPRYNCENEEINMWINNVNNYMGLPASISNEIYCGIKENDREIENADKIIICGNGRNIVKILEFLKKKYLEDRIVAIVDNDINKQCNKNGEIWIHPYEDYYEELGIAWIIYNKYDFEIFTQLVNNGVENIHWWID